MSLLGVPLLVTLIAAATVLCLAVGFAWTRWPGGLRLAGRAVSLVLVMAMGAVLAGDVVNRQFGFYVSWSDLTGGGRGPGAAYEPPDSFASGTPRLTVLDPGWQPAALAAARAGRGTVLRVDYAGARSGVDRAGLLYLPAAYFTTGDRLPAVELFHGAPGRAENYVDQLHLGPVLDAEIAAGRIPPVIAAVPQDYLHRFSECADAVHGERDETYLAVDVPADVGAAFRVLPGRSFAALGYSTGGFCATVLALHHPDRYAAAASLSGFFTAGEDPGTTALYGGSRAALDRDSPLWWVRHRHPTAPPLYLMASAGDVDAVHEDAVFAAALRQDAKRLPRYDALIPGGHNYAAWQRALPAALDWLAQYLPTALAPPVTLPAAPG